jgi:UDP-galactopyranose mutase
MRYNFLIVGAGLSGCVLAERIATQLNKTVLLIDKRDHIGGNCYDKPDAAGILVHQYGPHWFHTNDKDIFSYLSAFTDWHLHEHKVKTSVENMLLPIPINMDTINQLYNMQLRHPEEVQQFYDSVRVKGIVHPQNAEEMIISQVGYDLYNKFYKNYTIKQWDVHPKRLNASITARIPIRTNQDDRYFTDTYQGVPKNGYTEMFRKMINHKNITLALQTDFNTLSANFNQMIYTGPIDTFFQHQFGALPYRSLRFEHKTINQEFYQECQQVNYPNDFAYTRIVEWKHATGQQHPQTSITMEYPCKWEQGKEPFYAVQTKESGLLYNKYRKEADKLRSVKFCGRLADFKYYNMDQVIARAFTFFKKELCSPYIRKNSVIFQHFL